MATQQERILEYLRAHPRGADDDTLASELGIIHRQAVNQICRQLASRGVIVRSADPIAGKILNHLASRDALKAPRPPRVNLDRSLPVGRLVALRGEEELRQFVYSGE